MTPYSGSAAWRGCDFARASLAAALHRARLGDQYLMPRTRTFDYETPIQQDNTTRRVLWKDTTREESENLHSAPSATIVWNRATLVPNRLAWLRDQPVNL